MASKRIVALGAALCGAVGLAGCGTATIQARTASSVSAAAKCPGGTPTVRVDGYGTASATPDQVVIALGVQSQAPTAAAAIARNNSRASALVAKLEADGVKKADLQTSNLSVNPVYNNNGNVITGYQVTNDVNVTLHDVAIAGAIIDDAASVAGNDIRVDGVTFSVQDQSALLAQARSAAVRQAAGQARAMALAAGMPLGPLCSLQDNSSVTPPPPMFTGAAPASASTTPVEAGSLQVTPDVTAVYQLG